MWSDALHRHWYTLPVLSAVLLILSFHPFSLWPLAFIAAAPLYYFAATYRSLRGMLLGAFVAGALFSMSVSFFTVVQFHWLPEAYLFTRLVNFSFILLAVLGGLCWAAIMLAYRLLRSDSILLNTLVGTALFTLHEAFLYALFGGYYFALLGYAVAPAGILLWLANIGGVLLVTFVVAAVSPFLVEVVLRGRSRTHTSVVAGGALALVCAGLLFLGYAFVIVPPDTHTLSFALIQPGKTIGFGTEERGSFSFPELERRIADAVKEPPDVLVYPFSPVEGAIYRGAVKPPLTRGVLITSEDTLAAWLAARVPADTTAVIWTTLYDQEKFSNTFLFFKNGVRVAQYEKRTLFPFIDYTPQWAQRFGFFSTPFDTVPGAAGQEVEIDGVRVGAVLCSEIHRQDVARSEAGESSFLLSIGSEAMFVDDVASHFTLTAAQFRAAENTLPEVRANLLGPSGFIHSNGEIVAELARGEDGILKGEMSLPAPHTTYFSRWGNTPLLALLVAVLMGAYWMRRRAGLNLESL